MSLVLLLAVFVIFNASAVFAVVDTYDMDLDPENPIVFERALGAGVENLYVEGYEAVLAAIGNETVMLELFQAIQEEVGYGVDISVSYVSFNLRTGVASVTYRLSSNGEAVYNFYRNMFYVLHRGRFGPVDAAPVVDISLGAGSDYNNPAEPRDVGFVSVRFDGGRDSGGGCSFLTLSALALFLLPLFALKRGKK